jgi:hypothetical protein
LIVDVDGAISVPPRLKHFPDFCVNKPLDGFRGWLLAPRIEVRRVLNAAGDGMNSAPQPAEKVPRLRLIVKHFENRKHLPLVELERAA